MIWVSLCSSLSTPHHTHRPTARRLRSPLIWSMPRTKATGNCRSRIHVFLTAMVQQKETSSWCLIGCTRAAWLNPSGTISTPSNRQLFRY
jgi:hypothetical protein